MNRGRTLVFSSGSYHFFADDITGWFDKTDKKGKRDLRLRTNGGGLWEVDEDQWEDFDRFIENRTY